MTEAKRPTLSWMDLLWLAFIVGLAILPPVREIHKQLILLAFAVLQFGEGWLIARVPRRGPSYIVLLKIALATLLVDHTGELAINSYYYPIYFLPILTAAEYFGPWATLFWTTLASAAYCSNLYPGLHPEIQEFEITSENYELLAIRILFFFLAAMEVNRYVVESGARRGVTRNWLRPWPKPTAAWSRRRPRRGARSVSLLWASSPLDSRTRFATRWE